MKSPPHPIPLPLGDCVVIPFSSLRATKGSVAISLFSMPCEIASVVLLPRNDIVTQLLGERGRVRGSWDMEKLGDKVCKIKRGARRD